MLQLADSIICANVPNQIAGGSIAEDLGGNLISDVGPCIPLPGDFDGNFVIDGDDLAVVLGQWGSCRRGGIRCCVDDEHVYAEVPPRQNFTIHVVYVRLFCYIGPRE